MQQLIKNLQSLTNELIKPLVKPPSDPAARIDLAVQILVSLQQAVDMALHSSLPPTSIVQFCKVVQPSVEIVLERVQQQLLDNNPDREARRSATELVNTISKQVSVESTKSTSASFHSMEPEHKEATDGMGYAGDKSDDDIEIVVHKLLEARRLKGSSSDYTDDGSEDPLYKPTSSSGPAKKKERKRTAKQRKCAAVLQALATPTDAVISAQSQFHQCSKCDKHFGSLRGLNQHWGRMHRTEQV